MWVWAILAVYLVFKGKELVSLAELRPEAEREVAVRNAKQWFAASVLIAVGYSLLMLGSMVF